MPNPIRSIKTVKKMTPMRARDVPEGGIEGNIVVETLRPIRDCDSFTIPAPSVPSYLQELNNAQRRQANYPVYGRARRRRLRRERPDRSIRQHRNEDRRTVTPSRLSRFLRRTDPRSIPRDVQGERRSRVVCG